MVSSSFRVTLWLWPTIQTSTASVPAGSNSVFRLAYENDILEGLEVLAGLGGEEIHSCRVRLRSCQTNRTGRDAGAWRARRAAPGSPSANAMFPASGLPWASCAPWCG